MTDAEHALYAADTYDDSDAGSFDSLSSSDLSDTAQDSDGPTFDAAACLRQREAEAAVRVMEARRAKLVIDSDQALHELMRLPLADIRRTDEEHMHTPRPENPVTWPKATHKRPLLQERQHIQLHTDVYEVRQAIRRVYRSMPHHDFVTFISLLLRGTQTIKNTGNKAPTYWHVDDPAFKQATGVKETNHYTRELLRAMGFVKLIGCYWVWPSVHLAGAVNSESKWVHLEVPKSCPGLEQKRLDDVILLLKSCKLSLRKSGKAFSGHFTVVG